MTFGLYKDHFFLNPRALTDPDMGKFDNRRISGDHGSLENLEDYATPCSLARPGAAMIVRWPVGSRVVAGDVLLGGRWYYARPGLS